MPVRRSISLSTDDVEIIFSTNDGDNKVVVEISKGDKTLFLQKISANDFKDFQRMLGSLKPSLTASYQQKGD